MSLPRKESHPGSGVHDSNPGGFKDHRCCGTDSEVHQICLERDCESRESAYQYKD